MIWTELAFEGVWLIQGRTYHDARGTYTRLWDTQAAAERGLETAFVQMGMSVNPFIGTVRGLHWQAWPQEEIKLVRCARGALFDVIVDLHPGPTFGRYLSLKLSEGDETLLYIGTGYAHGFQTVTPYVEVAYQMSTPYTAEAARGIRWDDPQLNIPWPLPVSVISERDQHLPLMAGLESPWTTASA